MACTDVLKTLQTADLGLTKKTSEAILLCFKSLVKKPQNVLEFR